MQKSTMKIVEEYEELIERDSVDISHLWKYLQILLYLLSTASGYICSILFYILWQHCFGGNCLLWANFIMISKLKAPENVLDLSEIESLSDLWKFVSIDSRVISKCNMYLTTCFLSCLFGIVWFAFFCVCGRGGYNLAIYDNPWTIVFPALVFNFVFSIINIYANHNFQAGYRTFNVHIKNVLLVLHNSSVVLNDVSDCEIIQTYAQIYNFKNYDVCNLLVWLKIFSDMMMWSWIGGVILLLFRIVTIADFRMLKVRIYTLPSNNVLESVNKTRIEKNNEQEKKEE